MSWLPFLFNPRLGPVTPPPPTPYPPPTGLTVEINGDGIRLNWNDSDAARWWVSRNSEPTYSGASFLGTVNGNDTPTFMDGSPSQGSSYWYFVVAEKTLDGGIFSEPAETGEVPFNP